MSQRWLTENTEEPHHRGCFSGYRCSALMHKATQQIGGSTQLRINRDLVDQYPSFLTSRVE